MRARDFFESVRAAAQDAERTSHTLLRMQGRELPRGMGTTPGNGGGTPDVMRPSDAVMDYEAMVRRRVQRDWDLIDEACCVIYGVEQDGTAGVNALLGSATADALWWRYCAAVKWQEVADKLDLSKNHCQHLCNVAFDMIDSLGVGAVKAADGGADW